MKKLAIIGAGGMAAYHINGFRAGGAEVVAIADVNAEAAAKTAAQHGIGKSFGDVAEMFAAMPELDGVSIIVPNKFHAPLALQAMQAGKHVFLEKPLMGAMLYAEEIPSTGGNTLFANMYDAYDSLTDELKTRVTGLQAVHVFDYETQVKSGRFDRSSAPHATHPAIRTHPETGRKALYVNRLMTEELVGLPRAENDDLLQRLYRHAEDSTHVYEHIWQVNDLVMWDNRCTQHARTDFPTGERRLLRRVGIEGDRPV